jgi:hypothetical protein
MTKPSARKLPQDEPPTLTSNNRIHLTRWAVTALAEKHRRQNHRPGLPGPRQPQPAGDANVRLVGNAALTRSRHRC